MHILLALLISVSFGNYNKCSGCHGPNPSKKSGIAPKLTETPFEAFYLKVVKGKYPDGYKPKQDTDFMPTFDLSEGEVKEIYDYVKGFKK